MVEARRYDQVTSPGATALSPTARPEDFGAAVGQAISGVGDALVRMREAEKRLTADQEAATFSARFAEAREEFDRQAIDARNAAGPGAAGHAERMAKWWDERSASLLEGVTNGSVRRNAEAQLGAFKARASASEYEYEVAEKVALTVTDQRRATDIAANRARRSPEPAAFAEELRIGQETIDALSIPDKAKRQLLREHDQAVAAGYLNGLNDTNPQGALALIDKGFFDALLPPEQIEQARNGAQVEIRRAEAAAQHQAALSKEQMREEVQSTRAIISGGGRVPDEQLAALAAKAEAAGDTGTATEIGVMRIEQRVIRETEGWTPQQLDGEINRLAGLANPSNEQRIRLETLRERRPAQVSTYNNNPGEWAALNGAPPPPIDMADPASLAARSRWAATVTRTTRRPTPLLSEAERRDLQARASASPSALIEVAGELAGFGADGYRAAREVAPNNPLLARLTHLDGATRPAVLRGQSLRQANRGLVDGQDVAGALRLHFFEEMGAAARLFDAGEMNAVLEIAKNLYADQLGSAGVAEWKGDEEDLNPWINIALGARQGPDGFWRGGLGEWNGAPVLLPDGFSQGAFEGTLRALALDPNAPSTPIFSNKQPMTANDLRRLTPVRRPDGRYEFHGPGGTAAHRRDGQLYVLDVVDFRRRQMRRLDK